MIQRGRKSISSLSVVRVDGAPAKLKPPASLSKAERVLFVELIEASGPRHFVESDMPLIISYVQATLLSRSTIEKVGKDKGALHIWDKATRLQTTLAMRLRLSPSSRLNQRATTRAARTGMTRPWAS